MTEIEERTEKRGGLFAACLAIASLYFAREILIPIALAVLLAFLLEPLAKQVERLHVGRFASALAATTVPLLILWGLSYFLIGQIEELGNQWPKYEKSIHQKFRTLDAKGVVVFVHANRWLQDFQNDFSPTNTVSVTNAAPGTTTPAPEVKPVPVEVRAPETSPLQIVRHLLGPSLNIVVMVFLVSVFCVFILAGRDDLRDRLVRIVGSRNIGRTIKLLEETGGRVSRYLYMQLIVNACYGVPITLGLLIIGIPNPLLWGIIAAAFRYIPYAGPWIAATMPLAVGFAIGNSLTTPLLVLALFCVVEIITANFVEPWLYGKSTGITPLAVLIAAVFWAWLWGPIGLLLSVPLTVCVVSIARHVPQLEMLDILFGKQRE